MRRNTRVVIFAAIAGWFLVAVTNFVPERNSLENLEGTITSVERGILLRQSKKPAPYFHVVIRAGGRWHTLRTYDLEAATRLSPGSSAQISFHAGGLFDPEEIWHMVIQHETVQSYDGTKAIRASGMHRMNFVLFIVWVLWVGAIWHSSDD